MMLRNIRYRYSEDFFLLTQKIMTVSNSREISREVQSFPATIHNPQTNMLACGYHGSCLTSRLGYYACRYARDRVPLSESCTLQVQVPGRTTKDQGQGQGSEVTFKTMLWSTYKL